MKIAICDDHPVFRTELKTILENQFHLRGIKLYDSGFALLLALKNEKERFDVVFMDWDLPGEEDGLSYAARYQTLDSRMSIIFVTGYIDSFVSDLFLQSVNVKGVLTKPVNESKLSQYLKHIEQEVRTRESIVLRIQGTEQKVYCEEVSYVESRGHNILLHLDGENRIITCRGKLEDMEKQFPDYFRSPHKSFLVNLHRLKRMEGSWVIMQSGEQIPISRTRRDTFRQFVFDYLARD